VKLSNVTAVGVNTGSSDGNAYNDYLALGSNAQVTGPNQAQIGAPTDIASTTMIGTTSIVSGLAGAALNVHGAETIDNNTQLRMKDAEGNYAQLGAQSSGDQVVLSNSNGSGGHVAILDFPNNTASPVLQGLVPFQALGGFSVKSQTVVASASSISPTTGAFHVSGTAAISTISAPSGCSGTVMCSLILVPDGAFTTNTSGNIALASTAVVNKALTMTYDPGTSKWYPSY